MVDINYATKFQQNKIVFNFNSNENSEYEANNIVECYVKSMANEMQHHKDNNGIIQIQFKDIKSDLL